MNTLEEAPRTVRKAAPPQDALESLRPSPYGYVIGCVAALAIHAGILFGWQQGKAQIFEDVEYGVEIGDANIEVELVAAPPAEAVVEAVEVPPEPEPEPEPEVVPPPEPVQELPPEPEKPPEMTLPEPPPVQQPPPPPTPVKPKPKAPKPQPKPKTVRAVGDGSSAVPGTDATTMARRAGGESTGPAYLRNPHPSYPEDARKLKQQGVVRLRVEIDENGNPASVSIVGSSGFGSLDERALSTVRSRWKFRPARVDGVAIRGTRIIPIRFKLE